MYLYLVYKMKTLLVPNIFELFIIIVYLILYWRLINYLRQYVQYTIDYLSTDMCMIYICLVIITETLIFSRVFLVLNAIFIAVESPILVIFFI